MKRNEFLITLGNIMALGRAYLNEHKDWQIKDEYWRDLAQKYEEFEDVLMSGKILINIEEK